MNDAVILLSILAWAIVGAIVGGYLGSMKNRTGEGVIFGGFLGIVGWFIVLLMPDGDSPKSVHLPASGIGDAPTCPLCRKKGLVGRSEDGSFYYQCPTCKEKIA